MVRKPLTYCRDIGGRLTADGLPGLAHANEGLVGCCEPELAPRSGLGQEQSDWTPNQHRAEGFIFPFSAPSPLEQQRAVTLHPTGACVALATDVMGIVAVTGFLTNCCFTSSESAFMQPGKQKCKGWVEAPLLAEFSASANLFF